MPEPDEIKSPAKTIMISLPGGASILNVLQLVEHLRKQEARRKKDEIQYRYHNRQAHRAHR
jgi:hypothetical protein